jgi:DNA topoisomerase IB
VLERIRKLAIPPAWTDVWICNSPNGHLQATGRDARGRKQYRYHPRFREVREETKYEHMMAFAKALPDIRGAISRDMARRGCRARRCWPPWCTCWRPRSSASATTTTPRRTRATA